MKLILTVECDLLLRDIFDKETVSDDLLHQCAKVKTGLYENIVIGDITKVEIAQPAKKTRKYRGN